jgi:hypothetical protein
MSQLDQIIPPEIAPNSELGQWLTRLAARPDVKTILEIGSSSGEGSTAALVEGMKQNGRAELFCVELSQVRFQALQARYARNEKVHCFCGLSVHPDGLLSPQEVKDFYDHCKTNLNKYPLAEVQRWLAQDIEYLKRHPVPVDVIAAIKEGCKCDTFDLVLADGGAFCGLADAMAVLGSRIIVLDDWLDVKNWDSYDMLAGDTRYELVAQDRNVRNGYAIFARKD